MTALQRVRLHGQLPGVDVPYWILSAAGGAACLAPWYRTTARSEAPVISWEGCPDDRDPTYRAASSGDVFRVRAAKIGTIPMGPAGSYRWSGFRDYLGADRSVGAIVDLRTAPDVWARILGVAGEGRETDTFAALKALREE